MNFTVECLEKYPKPLTIIIICFNFLNKLCEFLRDFFSKLCRIICSWCQHSHTNSFFDMGQMDTYWKTNNNSNSCEFHFQSHLNSKSKWCVYIRFVALSASANCTHTHTSGKWWTNCNLSQLKIVCRGQNEMVRSKWTSKVDINVGVSFVVRSFFSLCFSRFVFLSFRRQSFVFMFMLS